MRDPDRENTLCLQKREINESDSCFLRDKPSTSTDFSGAVDYTAFNVWRTLGVIKIWLHIESRSLVSLKWHEIADRRWWDNITRSLPNPCSFEISHTVNAHRESWWLCSQSVHSYSNSNHEFIWKNRGQHPTQLRRKSYLLIPSSRLLCDFFILSARLVNSHRGTAALSGA